ncbi:hypothetical protein J6590_065926 [Homalodisca vitripennis]|nr:hypothetical protein J6590_065926 [Homalodisca vitripennis]
MNTNLLSTSHFVLGYNLIHLLAFGGIFCDSRTVNFSLHYECRVMSEWYYIVTSARYIDLLTIDILSHLLGTRRPLAVIRNQKSETLYYNIS